MPRDARGKIMTKLTKRDLTAEQWALRREREYNKYSPFDYHKNAICFGIYYHWDGEKEQFYITFDNEINNFAIFFPKTHTKMRLACVDFPKWGGFAISKGETISVLGGNPKWEDITGGIASLTYTFGIIPSVEDDD